MARKKQITKFVLSIELGNDAMQTSEDVQDALTKLVQSQCITRYVGGDRTFIEADSGPIMDLNGNKVGTWEVK